MQAALRCAPVARRGAVPNGQHLNSISLVQSHGRNLQRAEDMCLLEIVMSSKYNAIFTPCGHSIRKLRDEAIRLKKADNISIQEAYDRVATRLRYSGWTELIEQKSDPKRDSFLESMYGERKDAPVTKELYAEFLKTHTLAASADAYRQFAVAQWKGFNDSGFGNLNLENPPLPPGELLGELNVVYKRSGAASLLAQNLSSKLLEATIWARKVFQGEVGVSESDESKFLASVIFCVTAIMTAQQKADKLSIPEQQLFNNVEEYYCCAQLEFISRRTEFKFELPGLEEIFTPNSQIKGPSPAEFLKKGVL